MIVRVKVPASSANLGAGFDSLGIALALYSRLEVEETESGLEITAKHASGFAPRDENNLIYRAMRRVFDKTGFSPKGIRIVQDSEIPMTRGLGSSSACIIGGMLAANVLGGRKLSYDGILALAAETEGHPDNVTPALYGGFCAACVEDGRVLHKTIRPNPRLKVAAMIPDYYVATRSSRAALPDSVSYKDAAYNISRAALLAMCMADGDMTMLKTAVCDRLHQQYRSGSVEGCDAIFSHAYALGARAVYLSGSGPTAAAFVDKNPRAFARGMEEYLNTQGLRIVCRILDVDNVGAVVSVCE